MQIDVWYPRLKAFTFDTIFLPLSCGEGAAMVHSYDAMWRHRPGREITALDVRLLQRLEARISEALDRPPFWDERTGARVPAFLRLCGRSPKDGEPDDRSGVWHAYLHNLDGVRAELSQLRQPNTEESFDKAALTDEGNAMLIAISRTPTLCVRSACHVCTGPGSPLPHLHRHWAHSCHTLHRDCSSALPHVH
jgi:hypothetical protein